MCFVWGLRVKHKVYTLSFDSYTTLPPFQGRNFSNTHRFTDIAVLQAVFVIVFVFHEQY